MQKTKTLFLAAIAAALASLVLIADDEEEREDHHGYNERASRLASTDISDPQYALYQAECGGCHLAYPPSLLPDASWRAIMGNLEEHFGDNAALDAPTADAITGYLDRYAAAKGRDKYGERFWRATRGRTPPLRITETDYFRAQHDEIAEGMVTGNPQVVGFSRCEACHRGADRGRFDEHGVAIPGYGRWDD